MIFYATHVRSCNESYCSYGIDFHDPAGGRHEFSCSLPSYVYEEVALVGVGAVAVPADSKRDMQLIARRLIRMRFSILRLRYLRVSFTKKRNLAEVVERFRHQMM